MRREVYWKYKIVELMPFIIVAFFFLVGLFVGWLIFS